MRVGAAAGPLALLLACLAARGEPGDTFSDTWVATDALGRRVPSAAEVGPPRPDRTVGIFYFLWHGEHIQGGPYDVTRILGQDPDAMSKPQSPPWGPLHAPHHWGQPLFGYYLTDDESVLRKHAQMLADAGVDVVIFDVTNQITYRNWYRALLRVWTDVRKAGNRTPQVAFLTPFWDPAKVVHELWHDLYEPGLAPDLWFRWEGKPLLLADPDLIEPRERHDEQNLPAELPPGHSLGQSFQIGTPFRSVSGRFPTWGTTNATVTLTLFAVGADRDSHVELTRRRFTNVADNAWLTLRSETPWPAGRYLLEASEASGRIGWWSDTHDTQALGQATAEGQPVPGDRTLRFLLADEEATRIRQFFTFRKPQPDYFRGPTQPDMWSWLEVHPQHVFTNSAGEKEQMSAGVAQNAVGPRLGSMSEPGARGRSFHDGATDTRPQAVRWGFNFAEQWERVLREDPRFVFVTGWNEWIAGRFDEFNGVRLPVIFVDQFDEEHSRDIEPMRGGHGDDYLYQLTGFIRRYKGARPVPTVTPARIRVDGRFEDWRAVQPEFRDTVGDPVHRRHRGWDPSVTYVNDTGRNDIVAAKLSFDGRRVYFYARTQEALSAPTDGNWMVLFLDVDGDPATGWLGYDFAVNRHRTRTGMASVERSLGHGGGWSAAGAAEFRAAGNEIELALPWSVLGLKRAPATLDFKWADNCLAAGDWTDFTLNGDAAPNDRFNYRARLANPVR